MDTYSVELECAPIGLEGRGAMIRNVEAGDAADALVKAIQSHGWRGDAHDAVYRVKVSGTPTESEGERARREADEKRRVAKEEMKKNAEDILSAFIEEDEDALKAAVKDALGNLQAVL